MTGEHPAPSAERLAEIRREYAVETTAYILAANRDPYLADANRDLLAALDHVAARLRSRLRTTYSDVDRAELKDLLAYLGAGEEAS